LRYSDSETERLLAGSVRGGACEGREKRDAQSQTPRYAVAFSAQDSRQGKVPFGPAPNTQNGKAILENQASHGRVGDEYSTVVDAM
jgi:hypothetical protein